MKLTLKHTHEHAELKPNGYDPDFIDNRIKRYKIDSVTGTEYLARIEDADGNILEEFEMPKGVEKLKELAPTPTVEEIRAFAEREGYKNLMDKGKKEFHIGTTRMQKILKEL